MSQQLVIQGVLLRCFLFSEVTELYELSEMKVYIYIYVRG